MAQELVRLVPVPCAESQLPVDPWKGVYQPFPDSDIGPAALSGVMPVGGMW